MKTHIEIASVSDESHGADADQHLNREEHGQEQVHHRQEQRHALVELVGWVLNTQD